MNNTIGIRSRNKNRLNASIGKNLQMNDDVYKLRREVMNHIYHAKNLLRANGIDLPRLDVRITDDSGCGALGMARLGDNIIWVSTLGLSKYKGNLRHIVLHEILHTVLSIGHYDNCPLMKPTVGVKPISSDRLDEIFLSYFKDRN